MAAECMQFPKTVDEFMEQYKIVDTERVYTNGVELIPIFRMQQWFEHFPAADVRPVVHGEWWLAKDGYYGHVMCSECHKIESHKTDFCPNCGAIMEKPQER